MKYLSLVPMAVLICFCSFYDGKDNSALRKFRNTAFPDYKAFCEFQLQTVETNADACMWVRTPGMSERKTRFKLAINDYCTLNNCVLQKLVTDSLIASAYVDSISIHLKTLNTMYKDLTTELASIADYNDPAKMFPEESMFFDDDGGVALTYREVSRELLDVRKRLDAKMDELLAKAGE